MRSFGMATSVHAAPNKIAKEIYCPQTLAGMCTALGLRLEAYEVADGVQTERVGTVHN